MDSLQRKGINFDLNTQALKEYYPKGDWHNAYADVRDFFEANGFEHIQGSGYHSVEAMSEAKAMAENVKEMAGNIPEVDETDYNTAAPVDSADFQSVEGTQEDLPFN